MVKMTLALHGAAARYRTSIAVTSGTEDRYSLLLKTLNKLVDALNGIFRFVVGEPLEIWG
jgi:hypothetical protein